MFTPNFYGMKIIKQLRDDELKIVAEFIRDNIFVPSFSKKRTIFLCGADLSDNNTGRYKMAKLFENNPRYELVYPEDLFDDLMAEQRQYNLLELENILADSVDSIILLPESPGSWVELGAFANNKRLVCKLIYVGQIKYEKMKSFINDGPVKLIKASDTGKVINISYDNIESQKGKIYRRLSDSITAIIKKHPINKNIANILETENFILPSIYLIDSITRKILYKLVQFATGQKKKMVEIATNSAISNLQKNTYIRGTAAKYEVTTKGIDWVRSNLKSANLDIVRIEILNSLQRKNTMVRAVNF